jgi:hypothetical protein
VSNNVSKVAYEVANLLPKQAALLEQQELTETQQTRLVDSNADKVEYEVTTLLPQQYDKTLEEIDVLQAQEAEILAGTIRQDNESAKKVSLLEQQELTETEQTALVFANTSKVNYEVSTLMPKQAAILEQQEISESINSAAGAYKLSYMLPAELSKLENEVVLVSNQNSEVLASTIRQNNLSASEISLKEAQELSVEYNTANILPKQVSKLDEEIDLLQVQETEVLANIGRQTALADEQITASQANTLMKQGLSTAQENLYIRQEAGFDEDYKYKIFTQLLGLRSTGLTQEVPGLNSGTGVGSANELVNALLTDAGIPVSNVLSDIISA